VFTGQQELNLSTQFGFVATFVVGKVALVQVSAYCCFTLPVTIAPMLHTHVHLHVALTRGANGKSWEPSRMQMLSEIEKH